MTRHQKRLSVPNAWPVARKTDKYTVKANAGPHGEAGVPLVILLRDVLGYVNTAKEANYAVDADNVLVNGEPVRDPQRPIGMFDILGVRERDEYYRVFPDEGGRLALTSIPPADADGKLAKVVDKHQVSGGDMQLSLHDGQTLQLAPAAADEYAPGDSIVSGFADEDVLAHFSYEEGALVTAVDGKHAGRIGAIEEIEVIRGSSPNVVHVDTGDGAFETIEEYVVVIDEQFVPDDHPILADQASDAESDDDNGGDAE